MTEHFGLGLFGLGPGLFGSVFSPQSIIPTPNGNWSRPSRSPRMELGAVGDAH
jgi:hypothetical protein